MRLIVYVSTLCDRKMAGKCVYIARFTVEGMNVLKLFVKKVHFSKAGVGGESPEAVLVVVVAA